MPILDQLADGRLRLDTRVVAAAAALERLAAGDGRVQVIVGDLPFASPEASLVALVRALIGEGWRLRHDVVPSPLPAIRRWLNAVARCASGRPASLAQRALRDQRTRGMPVVIIIDHGRIDPADVREALETGWQPPRDTIAAAVAACPELADVLAGRTELGEIGLASHLARGPRGGSHPAIVFAWEAFCARR